MFGDMRRWSYLRILEPLHNPLLEEWRIFFREQHLGRDCDTGLGVRQRRFCDEVQRIIVLVGCPS